MNAMKRLEFEQLPQEGDKAFAAFSLYLSLGTERSLATVSQRLRKSVTMLGRWSAKYDWPARVQAYAAHMTTVEREAQETLVRAKAGEWLRRQTDLREREWAMHEKCLAAADRALGNFMAKPSAYANLSDIARILEVASKLGRLSSGLAVETVEHTGEIDLNFRVEVEAAIKKVYGNVIDVEEVQP